MITRRMIKEAMIEMIEDKDAQINLSCLYSYFMLRGETKGLSKIDNIFNADLIKEVLREIHPRYSILFQTKKEDYVYNP